jgi:hypothetical protein
MKLKKWSPELSGPGFDPPVALQKPSGQDLTETLTLADETYY